MLEQDLNVKICFSKRQKKLNTKKTCLKIPDFCIQNELYASKEFKF